VVHAKAEGSRAEDRDEHTVHANFSSTSITAGHLTDDELETMDRLLKKMGVPEHLLKAAPPIDTEPEGDR
jgi:hypothetical protein